MSTNAAQMKALQAAAAKRVGKGTPATAAQSARLKNAASKMSNIKTRVKHPGISIQPMPGEKLRPIKGGKYAPPKEGPKGKYVGKEKYQGLTKNAPKGKYKGKYIGPDRFKGDAEAYRKYKEERRAKRLKGKVKGLRKHLPVYTGTPGPGKVHTM